MILIFNNDKDVDDNNNNNNNNEDDNGNNGMTGGLSWGPKVGKQICYVR